jgi:hypothetical protein
VHAICCYIPHLNSTQLHENDISTRYSQLQLIFDSIATLGPGHLIIAAGDLNAKVGGGELRASQAALAAIVQHNEQCQPCQRLSTHRSQQLLEPDASGQLLDSLCAATDMLNLTGLTALPSPPFTAKAEQAAPG